MQKRKRPTIQTSSVSTLSVVSPQNNSAALRMAMDWQARQVLAGQGRSRLAAVEVDFIDTTLNGYIRGNVSARLLDFATIIHSISGLKFCNFVDDGLSHSKGQVLPIESVTKSQWISRVAPKGSIQDNALRTLVATHWKMLRDLPDSVYTSTQDIITLVSCLRTAAKLRGRNEPDESNEIFRHIAAWGVSLAAVHLQSAPLNDVERALLRNNAFQLAMGEMHASVWLGKLSLISQESFALLLSNGPPASLCLDIALEHLEPLLALDDGPRQMDTHAYLWSRIAPPVLETVHWIVRHRATLPPNLRGTSEDTDFAFPRLDDAYLWFDGLINAIASSTRQTSTGVYSHRALRVLRSLVCMELCALEADVQTVLLAQKQGTDRDEEGVQRYLGMRLHNALRRMSLRLKLVTSHDTPLSDIYHITDQALYTCELLGDSLAHMLRLTDANDREMIVDSVQIARYWDDNATRVAMKLKAQ
ncbi:hypothetical protein CI109_100022 [Kwoniella shandongensis]|uniref:Uncharacterized protein n=1 Tax=Kwoniella shandongensis TaxID=1734106 RepID=A0A5M6BSC8_9TREE|nr:uncharacterized protein CI109_006005 [Kwoniella shandongensis]KAA5525697.1 hypothetical protein CI109_006005 [Kwoniella shandongensis]